MRAKLLPTILTILLPLGSGACGQGRLQVVLPPAELASCADEPLAPELPARDGQDATQLRRDRLTLEYILGLRSAGGDCRAKVAGLKAWRETAGD